MRPIPRPEALARQRAGYARAGTQPKTKILHERVELFGYHRKAAIRALRRQPSVPAPFLRGRPKEYDPDTLLPPLKAIGLAALQPCGERLHAGRPAGLRGGPSSPRPPDVRQALFAASRAHPGSAPAPGARGPAPPDHHPARPAPAPADPPFAPRGPKTRPVSGRWTRGAVRRREVDRQRPGIAARRGRPQA